MIDWPRKKNVERNKYLAMQLEMNMKTQQELDEMYRARVNRV